VQLWWGALFAALGGFSYTTLRLSTLVLWLAGTLASYGTLRALDLRVGAALAGALAFLVYPVAFVLAFSFMTDVPFVAFAWMSAWALVAGLERGRAPVLLGGLVFALLAFFVRPVAIALPAGVVFGALALERSADRRRTMLSAGLTVVVMALASIVVARFFVWAGEGNGARYRMTLLSYLFLVPVPVYLEAALSQLAHVGLAVVPVLLAFGAAPRRGAWLAAAALLAAAVVVSHWAGVSVSALKFAHTVSPEELGAARPLVQGVPTRGATGGALATVATAIGLGGAAVLLARIADALRRGGRLRAPGWAAVARFGLASFGLCFVLWFFYDRYYLPVVMSAVVLALVDATPVAPWRRAFAVVLLATLAVVDVTGTRDELAYTRAVTATAAELRAAGVPEVELDAGYAEGGWRLYAHPERLPPGKRPEADVPHVTANGDGLPWVIANAPLPGYDIARTVAVPTWWAYTDRLYVLRSGR